MDQETRRTYNSKNCSANARLEFRAAVIVDSKTRDGKDYVCLDLVFSENIKIRLFNPEKSQRDRSTMSVLLSGLFEALGDDFNDIPPCRGGFFEFLSEVTETLNRRKYTMIYAKLTVNEAGYIICGEGRAFSKEPDLEYTDGDTHFLTVDESVKSSPKESFMPEYEDISFEVMDSSEVVISSSPDSVTSLLAESTEESVTEVTVYSEVTTVNNVFGDIISFDTDVEPIEVEIPEGTIRGISEGTSEGITFDGPLFPPAEPEYVPIYRHGELAKDSTFDDLFPKGDNIVVKHDIPVFDKPSDLDTLFSKPPGKVVLDEAECPSDPEEYRMPEAVEFVPEKPKKKEPRPKIPKGQDPLRYIKGDPDDIVWDRKDTEPKKIDFSDLPQ